MRAILVRARPSESLGPASELAARLCVELFGWPTLRLLFEGFTLDLRGIHGVHHWGRVIENGLRLGERNGANLRVVVCFGLLHDCRRQDDAYDPGHGARAARLVDRIRHTLRLISSEPDLLAEACAHHSSGRRHADPTIGTCWDADRLDLARPGVELTPDPRALSTGPPTLLVTWAVNRARNNTKVRFMERLVADATRARRRVGL